MCGGNEKRLVQTYRNPFLHLNFLYINEINKILHDLFWQTKLVAIYQFILDNRHQVEMDFSRLIFGNSRFNYWFDCRNPILSRWYSSMIQWSFTESIQFVQTAFNWYVSYIEK